MTQHTNGPWAIETCNENGPYLDSFYLSAQVKTWDGNDDQRIICRLPTGTGQFSDIGRENIANARLISTAPELLQIAKDYVLLCQLHDWEGAVLDSALAAIAKAEGK